MSANRLRPQGSANSRGSGQARLAASGALVTAAVVASSSSPGRHSATFWPNVVLPELPDHCNDNNASHLASNNLAMNQQQQRPGAWVQSGQLGPMQGMPTAASFTSLQELYGQELGRSGGVSMHGPAAGAHVKAESALGALDQHNGFLQCRSGDQLDLNYGLGWERYISS